MTYSTAVRRYRAALEAFQDGPTRARFESLRVAIRAMQDARNARNAARRVRK